MAVRETRFKPFIKPENRHNILASLARRRFDLIDETINLQISNTLAASLDASNAPVLKGKQDGKNGALDGATSWVDWTVTADDPWSPWQPPKVPKGKETKEGKEQKDGKETKEGKEAKDGKEGKDSSDGGKSGAGEGDNQVSIYGDPGELNWAVMNEIAVSQAARVDELLSGEVVI
jgi:hypothetical protein